jgi:tetratricopeptide (TPR) repeat protein
MDSYEEQALVEEANLPCHLNTAACLLKLGQFTDAKDSCNKALDLSPGNPKGLYRRAAAYRGLEEYDAAKDDLERCIATNPDNAAAVAELRRVKAAASASYARDSITYQGMFQGKPLLPAIRPGAGTSEVPLHDAE